MVCKQCGKSIPFYKDNMEIDFSGTSYNTKLVRCPYCNYKSIVGYEFIEDHTNNNHMTKTEKEKFIDEWEGYLKEFYGY